MIISYSPPLILAATVLELTPRTVAIPLKVAVNDPNEYDSIIYAPAAEPIVLAGSKFSFSYYVPQAGVSFDPHSALFNFNEDYPHVITVERGTDGKKVTVDPGGDTLLNADDTIHINGWILSSLTFIGVDEDGHPPQMTFQLSQLGDS